VLPYSGKNIHWTLEQISVPYLVGEEKFTDISADFADANLRVNTNREILGTGINGGYSRAGC
jgi:hypothetical protein